MAYQAIEFLLSGLTDSAGDALSGGKVYTYDAGTTNARATYQDIEATTPHANPIILDSNGRKQVFAQGRFKIRVDDADDNTLYTWDDLHFGDSLLAVSTTETLTGESFLGDLVYIKAVSCGTLPNTTSSNTAHGISNIDNIISISGFAKDPTTPEYRPLPYSSPTAADNILVSVNNTNITITTGADETAFTTSYIILKYTKTS